MASVTLENVRKKYGTVQALRGISFECVENEFLVILGPSGAGKTSTLKMIAGLEPVTEGEICLDGKPVSAIPPEERGIAMVFETYALYPHMSVFENLAFPLKSKQSHLSKEEITKRVRETAETLQIGCLLNRKPAELSGGQKQRVSLGRALIRKTGLLLMDEPISHLDAKLRHRMRRELKKYHRTFESTVVYVTHDYLEALALADRIVVLNEGRIHQIGAPGDVYHKPADTFVAALFGQPRINLVPIVARDISGGGLRLDFEGEAAGWTVSDAFKKKAGGAGAVTIGVRPQHLRLAKGDSADGIAGEVYVVENLGVQQRVEIKVGRTVLNALCRDADVAIGQKITVQFPEDRIMVFDRMSGRRRTAA